jgi:hypothetical protein
MKNGSAFFMNNPGSVLLLYRNPFFSKDNKILLAAAAIVGGVGWP